MDKPVIRDAALLILRIALGVVFIAHGYDRWFITGMVETTGQFSALGIPQPKLSAYLAGVVELLGGGLLVVGLLTTVAASALILLAASALYFVHLENGFFIASGGIEYVSVLIAALLIIVVFGTGRASVDGVLQRA